MVNMDRACGPEETIFCEVLMMLSCETDKGGAADAAGKGKANASPAACLASTATTGHVDKLQVLLSRAQAYSQFLSARLQESLGASSGSKRAKASSSAEEGHGPFVQPSLVTGGRLREYQLEGVQWLISLYENGLNGILADEMGLGKTVQCISFLAFLKEQGVEGPFLVVAPLSTLSNWMHEISTFAPSIEALLYYGGKEERAEMRAKFLNLPYPRLKRHQRGARSSKGGGSLPSIVVTSNEIAMRDARKLLPIRWKYLIVDEGHRLKNYGCRLMQELKQLHADNRLLLTGTPLQNNLAELWSLLNFLLPQIFTDVDEFLDWFDIGTVSYPSDDSCSQDGTCSDRGDFSYGYQREMVAKLHVILKPLLLRRLKVDVEREIPPKGEYLLLAIMSGVQRRYYNSILDRGNLDEAGDEGASPSMVALAKRSRTSRICYDENDSEGDAEGGGAEVSKGAAAESVIEEKGADSKGKEEVRHFGHLSNRIMQLRKVCNHPFLFSALRDEAQMNIVKCSGKMVILDQLLPALLSRGHKVLIFSQMVRMLDILGDYLDEKGFPFCRLDGSTSSTERKQAIDQFNAPQQSGCQVFLLSTRAGGLGINLIAADSVIFYDSDWNPQVDLQAQDRAHRIGQKRPVVVYRLVIKDSVEEHILRTANSKRHLERLVIHRRRFKGARQQHLDQDAIGEDEFRALLQPIEGERGGAEASGPTTSRVKALGGSLEETNCLTEEDLALLLDRSPAALSGEGAGSQAAGSSIVRRVMAPSEPSALDGIAAGAPHSQGWAPQ